MKCLLSQELRLLQYFEQRRNRRYLRSWQKSYSRYWNINYSTSGIEMHLSGLKAYGPDGTPPPPPVFWRRMPKKYRRFLLISIKTVSIPELYPANGNMPTYVPFTRKERNRIHQTIGPYHLLASLQKYLSALCTAMLWITCGNIECPLITNMSFGQNDRQKHSSYVPFMK